VLSSVAASQVAALQAAALMPPKTLECSFITGLSTKYPLYA
jgi:hypothetical protein